MRFILLNLIVAVVPSFLLLLYFYKRDKNKKEPPKLVWKTFAFGLLAVIPALGLEIIGGILIRPFSGIFIIFLEAFIVTALVEEFAKFLVIRFYMWRRLEFDEVADGIVYTIAAGLGFAMLENLLYSFGSTLLLVFRGITAVPLHAISAGIMGYYLGISKVKGKKKIFAGIFYAVMIHGLYDFFLFTQTFLALFVLPLLIFGWFLLRRLYKKALLFDQEDSDGDSKFLT